MSDNYTIKDLLRIIPVHGQKIKDLLRKHAYGCGTGHAAQYTARQVEMIKEYFREQDKWNKYRQDFDLKFNRK